MCSWPRRGTPGSRRPAASWPPPPVTEDGAGSRQEWSGHPGERAGQGRDDPGGVSRPALPRDGAGRARHLPALATDRPEGPGPGSASCWVIPGPTGSSWRRASSAGPRSPGSWTRAPMAAERGRRAAGLPRSWRLGSSPTCARCTMTPASACPDGRPTLPQEIGDCKSLTSGAASGVRVHTLPKSPVEVEDDGVPLRRPRTGRCSESGKPSAEALRYLSETTGPDGRGQQVTRCSWPCPHAPDWGWRGVRERLAGVA